MTAEVISAIAIVGALAVLLASAVGRERAAAAHLADSRSAARLAERAVLALQLHQHLEQVGGAVHVTRLVNTDAATAPAGFAWVKLQASVGGRNADLTALVPADSAGLPSEGAPR